MLYLHFLIFSDRLKLYWQLPDNRASSPRFSPAMRERR